MRKITSLYLKMGPLSYLMGLSLILSACGSDRVGFNSTEKIFGAPFVVINNGDEFTRRQAVELEVFFQAAKEMYITNDSTCDSGGEYQPYETNISGWLLANRNTAGSVFVKFRTESGRESECLSDSIIHDDIPPTVSFAVTPPAVNNLSSTMIEFETDDNLSGVDLIDCSTDGQAYSACSETMEINDMVEGAHNIVIRVTDKAGNIGQPLSHNWTVDFSVPVAVIKTGPRDPNNLTDVTLEFEGNDPNGGALGDFMCRLGNQTFVTCQSPMTYTNVVDGNNSFFVIVRDQAGNISPSASHAWLTDTVPPTVTINAMPNNPTNLKDATFEFAGADDSSGVVSYECTLNGVAAACSSPVNYLNLPDGTHNFSVTTLDAAGNRSLPASYTWEIDTVVPTVRIVTTPSNPTNQTSATFTFTDDNTGVVAYLCQLDAGNFVACASPQTYANLADGNHTFMVKGQDAAGNESLPVSYAWLVDTVAPTVAFISTPPNPSGANNLAFQFSAADGGSGVLRIECSLDGAAYAACTSPVALNGLTDGSHTFSIQAIDNAGNTSLPVSYTWVVDATAPVVVIDTTPNNPTNQTTATFTFTGTDGGSGIFGYECKLDAGAFVACSSPQTYANLAAGSHTFTVVAVDNVGLKSAPVSFTWVIDLTAPSVQFNSTPNNPSNSNQALFAFVSNESNSTFECRIDQGAYAACTSPHTLTGLADGPHTFYVRATDNVGNQGNDAQYTWDIDTVAPVLTFVNTPLALSPTRSALFEYTVLENGSGLASHDCELDGNPFLCPVLGTANISGLADGTHNFKVTAIDNAGNMSSVDYTWDVEAIPVCYDKQFVQPDQVITKKIDILFVSDSSGSLDAERGAIAAEIDSFVAALPADADFRIGVLLAHGSTSARSGVLYQKAAEPVVLDSELMTLTQIRTDLLSKLTQQPSDGGADGGELGLFSLSQILSGTKLANAKAAGFFRDDSALAVVFLADENDICAEYPAGITPVPDPNGIEPVAFQRDCQNPTVNASSVYTELTNLQQDRPLLVSGIIYTDPTTVPAGGENEVGYGYTDIISLNNGLAVDLAAGNYAAGLADIGNLVTIRLNLMTRFPLDYPNVDPDAFIIKIDDVPTTDFTYNPVTNEVEINNPGQALSVIDIRYCTIP